MKPISVDVVDSVAVFGAFFVTTGFCSPESLRNSKSDGKVVVSFFGIRTKLRLLFAVIVPLEPRNIEKNVHI